MLRSHRPLDNSLGLATFFITGRSGVLLNMKVINETLPDSEAIMVSAKIGLFSNVGGTIGYAVAAAVYTNTFPRGLPKALPENVQSDWESIYLGGYASQFGYAPGTAIREAIHLPGVTHRSMRLLQPHV